MIALRARRLLADGVERPGWWLTIERERIVEIGPELPRGAHGVDLGDVDLVPGLIDLHSDCLEALVRPRPSAELPLSEALYEMDASLVAHGITTNYLCIALEGPHTRFRTRERALATARALQSERALLRADHRIHLRVDVTSEDPLPLVPVFAAYEATALISYMDHSPGQGQYANAGDWRKSYARNQSQSEVDARLAAQAAGHVGAQARQAVVAEHAHRHGAVLASHDDDGAEAVARAVELGARICEFPVNAEAAAAAVAAGLGTVMGAPNARRGGSHVANLSAREALAGGWLDALASDYHPPSLICAAYALAADGACSWADALRLVTSGPARIAGLSDRGRLAPGMRADVVAVAPSGRFPFVRQTWVGGVPILGVQLHPASQGVPA